MSLEKIILENERLGKSDQSKRLIQIKLKELVNKYPDKIADLLTLTGIQASMHIPKSVLLSMLVKHLPNNSELRTAIARVLLEDSGYSNADGKGSGKGLSILGAGLQAVGSILGGIGRSQSINSGLPTDPETLRRQEEARKRRIEEEEKRKRTTAIIVTIVSIIAVAAAIIGISMYMKKKKAKELAGAAPKPPKKIKSGSINELATA